MECAIRIAGKMAEFVLDADVCVSEDGDMLSLDEAFDISFAEKCAVDVCHNDGYIYFKYWRAFSMAYELPIHSEEMLASSSDVCRIFA